ncbi:mas-related G-protein coupled receptor member H-like [Poecilia latipinna]|uniref:mas-related G-protein coupled receptor member H-like n=1 Tax=Poecilia latipinna TaxID=48699 RepID=UPI00072DF0AC|nr:PREDICTED: mas-related G-protein coupled receptor member H-like [Poecilia latipinna]
MAFLQKQVSHQEASSLDKSDTYNQSFQESNMHNHNFNVTVYAHVGQLIVASIGLPLTVIAIFAVYLLIKKDHVTPVYIINLLLSDLIQLCCMIAENLVNGNVIVHYTYFYGLMVSIGFMVCISLERYLAVAWPLWYRFRRNIKTSLVVCVVIWMLPTFFLLSILLKLGFQVIGFFCAVFFILPLPLLTFFLNRFEIHARLVYIQSLFGGASRTVVARFEHLARRDLNRLERFEPLKHRARPTLHIDMDLNQTQSFVHASNLKRPKIFDARH